MAYAAALSKAKPPTDEDGEKEPEKVELAVDRPTSKTLRDPLVWIDLEMTGLDPQQHTIIEIACLLSDGSLNTVVEGPEIAIHTSEEELEGMNEWCQQHHYASGLVDRCRGSSVSMEAAEEAVLAFVRSHVPTPGRALLAGNSVHMDLVFMRAYMPRLAEHLHFRIVDVSTVQELAKRWFPKQVHRAPKKKSVHTAMSDIRESLEQLRYLKRTVFRQLPTEAAKGGSGSRPNSGRGQ